jgi:probable HAF family extracellular repeat protein
MPDIRRAVLNWSLLVWTAVLTLARCASAAPEYTIIDLGTLGGTSSIATGINDLGEVVGYSSLPNLQDHAFLYSAGQIKDLGTLGGGNSAAFGINNSSEVVGDSETTVSAELDASTYSNMSLSSLLPNGIARGVNDSGQIVGDYSPPGSSGTHAFLFSSGSPSDLGTLGGNNSNAYAINAVGQVVGQSDVFTSAAQHAFLYSSGNIFDLGTLGGTNSSAYAINASGQIVGQSDGAGDQNSDAFLYSNGTMHDLGDLGGGISLANGINASGQIVGYSYTISGESVIHAFTVFDGQMFDLNSLLPASSGWLLVDARAINNEGQIVGWGINPYGQHDAFLLSPTEAIPEPALPVLGILMSAALCLRRASRV